MFSRWKISVSPESPEFPVDELQKIIRRFKEGELPGTKWLPSEARVAIVVGS
jgi:hypothetical protein